MFSDAAYSYQLEYEYDCFYQKLILQFITKMTVY
jgi:hypothetical protein